MSKQNPYASPRLYIHGTVDKLTRGTVVPGKNPGGNDGQSDTGIANSKCPGANDGSLSYHNPAEDPAVCS